MADSKFPIHHGIIWVEGDEVWFTWPSKYFSKKGHSYHIPGGAMCFPKKDFGREKLLKVLRSHRDIWGPGSESELIRTAECITQLKWQSNNMKEGYFIRVDAPNHCEIPPHHGKIWLDDDVICLSFPPLNNIEIAGRPPLQIAEHLVRFAADLRGITAAEATLSIRELMMKKENEALLLAFAEKGTDLSAILGAIQTTPALGIRFRR